MCENVSLWFRTPDTIPPPLKVTSCWIESPFVHTTVEPTVTVTVAGENAKFVILTASVATDAVGIKNFAFSPATITVKAGSTVVWTNDDSIQHDVTFDGGGIASSVLNHSDTFSHTFPTAGTYHYICSIHPFMHGTVIVTA